MKDNVIIEGNNKPIKPELMNIISEEEKVKKKREMLFKIQTIISIGILIIIGFTFLIHYNLEIEKPVKIVFAPFLSVVPLLFILTILKEWITNFSGEIYSKKQIIINSLTVTLISAVFVFITHYLSVIKSVEILVAVLIAILSIIAFISFKYKNIRGMAIITGIAEGLIIYMVFMF